MICLALQNSVELRGTMRRSQCRAWLSADEAERVAGISAVKRREQFLAARYLVRRLLVMCHGGKISDWQLSASPGKPPTVIDHPQVSISISHCGEHVLCAVGDAPLGVDIERVSARRDELAMAGLVCGDQEQRLLRALQPAVRSQEFTRLWTLKEARIKQIGMPAGFAEMRATAVLPAQLTYADAVAWYFPERNVAVSLAAQCIVNLRVNWPRGWPSAAAEGFSFA